MVEVYVVKARLKFNKYGAVKFVGHLDLMRFFQKSFRRVGVDIAYSQGYHPHQLTSFASPLGVGITSDGEYMDMELNSMTTEKEMLELINSGLVEGIEAVSFHCLQEESKTAMSVVAGADYLISLRDGYQVVENFAEHFTEFMNQEIIRIMKKTKKSETEVDIRPLIFGYGLTEKAFVQAGGKVVAHSVATQFTNDNHVFVQVSAGSVNNLKPELIMQAFCQYVGQEYQPLAYQIHRIEMYANGVTKEELEAGVRRLVPLEEYQVER